MPRYEYTCGTCDTNHLIHHGMHDAVPLCELCGKELDRRVSGFRTRSSTTSPPKIGTVTEDFIKTARDDLKQQKEELEDNR